MDFSEQLRMLYRQARKCVWSDDASGAAKKCQELSNLCETQYSLKNGDKLKTKAELKYYSKYFSTLSKNIQNNGLNDKIKKRFGFTEKEPPLTESNPKINKNKKPSTPHFVDPTTTNEKNGEELDEEIDQVIDDAIDEAIDEITDIGNDKNRTIKAVFDPETLADFIGQQEIVKRIQAEIKAAKKQGLKYIDHIFLFGNRGLGKSTLMKLIAKELDVQFEFLDCSQFRNDVASQRAVQNFFQRIGNENKPVVIGMDEIHELPKKIQSGLLTLLNDRKFIYMDNNGTNHTIPINDFTFIGATTDAQDILPTVKDRCLNLTFYLKDYKQDELFSIFCNKFASKKLQISDDALVECIQRCRSSIRQVNSIVNGLNTLAIIANTNFIDTKMTNEYFKNAEIDPIGLNAKDLEILNVINSDMSGVMSEDTIATRVDLELKIYRSEYEPYLIKIGFISITGRGRSLTEKARLYLRDGTHDFDKLSTAQTKENTKENTINELEKPTESAAKCIDPIDELKLNDE